MAVIIGRTIGCLNKLTSSMLIPKINILHLRNNHFSQQDQGIQGKVALVTGSTSGIGLGIAHGLANQGCSIVLNGFGDQQLINNLKLEFSEKYNVQAGYVSADLGKSEELSEMCNSLRKLHPCGIDILVNNAGFQHVSPIEDFPDNIWDSMISVMLTAPFQLIKKLMPEMRQKGWGRIINISSVHGLKASPNKSAYVTCKHGILGLTKVIALETAGSGVTCNAICPGYADTPILQNQVKTLAEKDQITYNEAKVKFLSSFHPSGEPVGIKQLADTVCYICSDAASQMTGSNVVLDGGWASR